LYRVSRLILAALALAAAQYALAQTAAEGSKIGFVNLDRILREATPARLAQEQLERDFKKRQEELARMAEQLKHMQETLDKQGSVMAEAERRKLERDCSEGNRDLERKSREFRDDVNQRRNTELQGILERANRVVREIAERDRYDIIFQDAVWASARIDITARVIKALDESVGRTGAGATPGASPGSNGTGLGGPGAAGR
jgi:outer membrane protein